MSKVKLLLVDDHELFIEGLSKLLSSFEQVEVLGAYLSGHDALESLEKSTPDIVLTDLSMPNMDGSELVNRIKHKYPEIKVLVLTMHNDRPTISKIIMAEAEGYLLKNSGKNELLQAIETVNGGGTYYANAVLNVLLEKAQTEQKKLEASHLLTEREIEILGLVAEEKTSREIAEELSLSVLTVDTHRKNLLKKTGSTTVIGLLKFGVSHGLISLK